MLEKEIKFIIPDRSTYQKILRKRKLAGHPLSDFRRETFKTSYLDTEDKTLLDSGWYLRKRKSGNRYIITLKSEKRLTDFINKRKEFELSIEQNLSFEKWPDCKLKSLVKKIIKDKPLKVIFSSSTQRALRTIAVNNEPVAILTIDDVKLRKNGKKINLMEMEIEIIKSSNYLIELCAKIKKELGLKKEKNSKFMKILKLMSKIEKRK